MKNKILNIKNQRFIFRNLNSLLLVTGYWLLVTGFLNGCATIYNPATQKKELILIDTQAEVLLGRNMDVQVAQSFEVIKDAGPSERVNKIGRDIALVADRQDLKYVFRIVKNKEVNAFATPGGFIYLNTGLLDRVDDDELACVLAHEVGHIAARHIVKKLQTQIGYDILMSLAFGKGGAEEVQKAINITFNLVSLGYSRDDEYLADKLAVKYAYKAGYDPEAMIRFFKKLKELEKDKTVATPLFLRSHPYLDQRITRAGKEIAALKDTSSITSPLPGQVTKEEKVLPSMPVKEEGSAAKTSTKPQTASLFYGLSKKCPACGKTYPKSYQYCPKDGTKLTF